MPCDVTEPATLDALFETIRTTWGSLDFVLHAVAFSDKDALKGRYIDGITRENFLRTMDISCFSFTDICRRAEPLMTNGGSLLTLSYLRAPDERVIPHATT